jgi:signal transduction histidine kinase/ligand-binding sensor domain-containing protein
VYAVAEDADGTIWVGTQSGLNRIDAESGLARRVPLGPDSGQGNLAEYVTALHLDTGKNLWVATVAQGIFVRRAGEQSFSPIQARQGFLDPSAFAFMTDSEGQLWVGGVSSIFVLKDDSDTFQALSLLEWSEDEVVSVTSFVESTVGTVFAGTFGDGLFEVGRDSLRVTHHPSRPGVAGSLPESRLTGMAQDPGGGLVVSTWGAGLQRTTSATRMFSGMKQIIDSTGELTDLADVYSLVSDDSARIWGGSLTNGLLEITDGATGPEPLSVPVGDLTTRLSIVSVRPMDHERMLVGTTSGFFILDQTTRNAQWYRPDADRTDAIGPGWITAFAQDSKGEWWIGTGGAGLWKMTAAGGFAGHTNDPDDPTSLSGNYVTSLRLDESGQLWVGTRSHGLNLCRSEPFACRQHDPAKGSELRHHYVTAIHQDPAGEWWVGTAGGGLYRVELSSDGSIGSFEHFGLDRGVLDTTVVSFLDDDDGSLWIGTRRGLTRLDPARQSAANYLASDGLVSNVFNRGAAARNDEHLFFGTVNGVVFFPAGTPFAASKPAPLAFTQAQNLSLERESTSLNGFESTVSAAHGEVLQFSFAVLDYEGGPHSYEYRLGDDREWTHLDSTRQLTFADLPPGVHELQVRGRGARGASTMASLPIQIVPPFWMTFWFRLVVLMAIALLAFTLHQVSMARLQRRNLALQELHEEKERALEKLQDSEAELHQAATGLRRLTRRLETAKEEERQHISRELHDELGQTLTAAKIQLQLLQRKEQVSGTQLQDAVDMVNSMIDKVRDISFDLRPSLLDEAGLVAALKSELKKVSSQTQVPIELDVPGDFPKVSADIETVLFRITQEAVSNSLRHSGASRISVRLSSDPDFLYAVIRDNGCGFDVEQVRSKAMRGDHLGLLGLDERVNSVGGTVTLDSEPGQGTTLHIEIPARG